MPYSRRRIVEAIFDVGNGDEPHPFVILSKEEVYNKEGYYICAMISQTPVRDDFSFEIKEGYLTKSIGESLSDYSCVRTHLIVQLYDDDITSQTHHNSFTIEAFRKLIDWIDENVFGY